MPNELIQKIGLGTVQFGMDYGISNASGQTTRDEVSKILQLFKEYGGEFIDTALAYGEAEDVLGSLGMKDFNIISKFMPPAGHQSVEVQLNKTLMCLGVESIYGYLAHRPSNLLEHPGIWQELKILKSKGLIKKIGFSLIEPSDVEALAAIGLLPDIIQAPYNYFDRRFENILKRLRDQGCEIHTRSVFLQGLFFSNIHELPDFFDPVKTELRLLQKRVNNLVGSLLNFVVQKEFIDVVIIGVENSKQLNTNISSLNEASVLPQLTNEIDSILLNPSNWPKSY